MQHVRMPAAAGTFYPDQQEALLSSVRSLLLSAASPTDALPLAPKALIVPHAGYVYSGPTAALAYSQLARVRAVIKRVVLIGPVHRVPIRGLALPGVERFRTPLGDVALDQEAMASIAAMPQVETNTAAHAQEHSLEVQLPFLQRVLDDFKLVPLAVGNTQAAEVAQVLEALWGGPETLIVVSSDLSHFRPYASAQTFDRATVQSIMAAEPTLTHEQACGATPINGLLLTVPRHQLQPKLLGLCNSGDTGPDRSRVVGYASWAFQETCHAPR